MTDALLRPPLAPAREPTRDGVQRLLELARLHLGLDAMLLGRVERGSRVVEQVATADPDLMCLAGQVDPLGETYCGRMLAGELGAVVPDAAAEPRTAELPATRLLGLGAYLGVPLILPDGTVYGTLCGVSRRPEPDLGERDSAVLRLLADLVVQQIAEEEATRRRAQEIRDEIEAVLHEQRLVVLFQPIVSLGSGSAIAYEALSRFDVEPWRGPQEWFADAADVGMGPRLQAAALATALRHLPAIPEPGRLNLNVGAAELSSGPVRDVLDRVCLERVTLEITEDELHGETGRLLPLLDTLRARGAWIAVDDFGAGFTSLDRVLTLSPDVLKLDRTLVRDIDQDPMKRALVAATAAFADQVGLRLVAEGVERDAELESLREVGVPQVQGFYLGRPEPAPWQMSGRERRRRHASRIRRGDAGADPQVPRPRGWMPSRDPSAA